MKKALVYTAAMAAALACDASFAQSNVTLSGTLDVGVYRGYDETTKVGGIITSTTANLSCDYGVTTA